MRTAHWPEGANASHTARGWWLEEAGGCEARPPLEGDRRADVVIIGGGYTGLWTAWFLRRHAPDADVVLLEAEQCGHGPSGRNGGFVGGLWRSLPDLEERFGAAAAVATGRAAARSVDAIGEWCEAEGVDAWYRKAGQIRIETAAPQRAAADELLETAKRLGVGDEVTAIGPEEVRARCAGQLFGRGTLVRQCATVQPARLALGLRERVIAAGVEVYENSRVRGVHARTIPRAVDGGSAGGRGPGTGVTVETDGGRVRAPVAVLAVGPSSARVPGLRRRLTVASSHIVLTEPVPDVLEELGWTGGEALVDGRVFLHYLRTTRDGRIVFGWGGGRVAFGARVGGRAEIDRLVAIEAHRDLVRYFPQLAGRRITHAWGGPIDVSPTHLPVIGTMPDGLVHYAFGYTGNGVGLSHLAGRILAALAFDERTEETRLPLVNPPPVRVPPEPLRFVGGSLVRRAFLRKERAEAEGRHTDPLTKAVTEIPKKIGIHLGR